MGYKTCAICGKKCIQVQGCIMDVGRQSKNLLIKPFSSKNTRTPRKERELMIRIAETKKEYAAPIDFKDEGFSTELFSRLEKKELLIRRGRGKYSLFHPMFVEFLRKQ